MSQLAVIALFAGIITAQADSNSSEINSEAARKQRLDFATEAASQYHFELDSKIPVQVTLHPAPLLRWDNQVVHEDDGMLFLWTEGDQGRPVAMAQFFLQGNSWHHEFQSLSRHPFATRLEGNDVWHWSPKDAGLKFTRGDDAPAKTPPQRLRQMRAIAEQFTAAVDPSRGGKYESLHELRLLTTPVYRYAAGSKGVLDGAMFVFAQGTNPEVILLIEAVKTAKGDLEYQYGFAPMSSFEMRVRQRDKIVFEQPVAVVPTPDSTIGYHFRFNAQRNTSATVPIKDDTK